MAWTLYKITFSNGKLYIGITSRTLTQRMAGHQRLSCKLPVSSALRKHGGTISAIAVGERDYIRNLEIQEIEQLQTRDRRFGYNIAIGGTTSPMHIPAIAAKVGATKRRRLKEDPEYLARTLATIQAPGVREKVNASIRRPEVSAAKSLKLKGRKASPQTRANCRAAQGRPEMREARRIMSILAWADPTLRAEQSARMKARPPPSAETRAKISATLMGHPGALKGKARSPEICAKISASKMGHEVSQSTRNKIRQSWERKRALKEVANSELRRIGS